MDLIYQRMDDDTETSIVPKDRGASQIQEFYAGKTIFLTGCTSFIGKCILEKLLRQCPEIKRIYILIRAKNNIPAMERMQRYLQDIIFEKLHIAHAGFENKITMIHGDLTKPNIGISTEDYNLLTNCIDIIIHNAANTFSNERIKIALHVNVIGTQLMLDLAKACAHLESFMYISTAFSHRYTKYIEEQFRLPPIDLKRVYELVQMDVESTNEMDQELSILNKWPNVYTFSMATAEGLVNEFAKTVSFPCGIFKPSIVISTYKEPMRAWCDNGNELAYSFVGLALGIIHAIFVLDPILDIIPADMTANCLLAAVWDLSVYKKDCRDSCLYNYASSTLKPVKLKQIEAWNIPTIEEVPSVQSIWHYFTIKSSSYYVFYVFHILLHFIPAMLIDLFNILRLRKPIALPIFFKIHNNMDRMFKFTNGDWQIEVKSMLEVWDRMNDADHQEFYSDLRTLDWEDYFLRYWSGLRKFLLKDPLETTEIAQRKYRKLQILHYSIKTILQIFVLFLMFRIITYLLNYYLI